MNINVIKEQYNQALKTLRAGDAVGDGEGGGVGEAPAGTVVLAIGWNEVRLEEARGFTPKIELYLPRIINTIYDCTCNLSTESAISLDTYLRWE